MNRLLQAAIGVALTAGTTQLYAAGFYLKEQSIVSQGQAFAGVAAQSGLASSAYFNPAGLATLEATTLEGGAHFILTGQEVNGTASNSALGNANVTEQEPLDSVITIPNFYWATPVGESVVGVAVNAPFGSKNSYDEDYFGRFDHLSADLKTVDLTFAVGHQVDEQLNVGGAVFYQKMEVEQSKAAYYHAALGTTTSILKGDAADIGFSLGLQYKFPNTVVGLSYRSGTTHDVDGTNTVTAVSALTGGVLAPGTYAATAAMELPSITSIGIEHALDSKVDLYLGATRYDWSVYDTVTVNSDGLLPASSTTENYYNDTISYSLGLNYQYSSDMELRGGVHFDPTPTDDAYRSHSTPDGDRTWLSFGFSKQVEPDLIVDFAFSHIMADDALITDKSVGSALLGTAHTISSTTETAHNIFSIGLRKTF